MLENIAVFSINRSASRVDTKDIYDLEKYRKGSIR